MKKKEDGQAMVEFAIVLPILIFIVLALIEFGWIFGNKLLASNASREAARYIAIHYNAERMNDTEAKTIAEDIIASRAPTLKNIVVDSNYIKPSNDIYNQKKIEVRFTSNIDILTPFLSIFEDTYVIEASSTMRLE